MELDNVDECIACRSLYIFAFFFSLQYVFVAIAVSLPIPSGVFFPIFVIGEY